MTARRALVTGFGPFLDVEDNASGRLALALHGQHVGDVDVVGVVLPVSFADAPATLDSLLRTHSPECVLALGVGPGEVVRLERGADNRIGSAKPDADGLVWTSRELAPGGPARLETALPIVAWARELDTDTLGVTASDDAGGYVCNATYYELLARTSNANPCLFVHIPRECDAHRMGALGALCRTLIARLTQIRGVSDAPLDAPA